MKKLLSKKTFAVLAMALVLTFAFAATVMAAETDAKNTATTKTETIKVKDFDVEKEITVTNVLSVEQAEKTGEYTLKVQAPVTITYNFEIYGAIVINGKNIALKNEGTPENKDVTYVGKTIPSKVKTAEEDGPTLYEKGYAIEITEAGTYDVSAYTKMAVANDFNVKLEVVKADGTTPAAPVTPATPVEKKAQSMDNFTKDNNYATAKFTDVAAGAWYEKDVQAAYEVGIINGKGEGKFDPTGNLTLAEAITMAVKVNNIYNNTTFTAGGDVWYDNAVAYAIEKGIIAKDAYTDYNKNATRADLAAIFAKSLPTNELAKINEITALPDVTAETANHDSILALYQAGVLTGDDAKGTFRPAADITRAEAAAIINRVVEPEGRKTVTLEK